jgi:DNA polymerase-3 subunit gamma/tau
MTDADGMDMPSLGFEEPRVTAVPAAVSAPYRVLARKYRPSSFDDLIGQEAMVKTLSNAFELERIHQAYILTGVRGVGKTTTARILARAFNYELPTGGGPKATQRARIHMPELGLHCQAIIESRHVDVIEMDAASHTGIDDVREIIENARYSPVLARTKVYIIDEVHMLSKPAFNGLLKTLEEPPDHVKFIFATTEIEKVPVTVRSRCQRFDLRRIEPDVMIAHLTRICAKESVAIEPEALAIIARAAEGSVRDALSLLDQAIAHGTGAAGIKINGADVRLMLGLADRSAILDLFGLLMGGDIAGALTQLKSLYDGGGDPGQILVELTEFVHFVTRLKLMPEAAKDPAIAPEERSRGAEFAQKLSIAVLTRTWQTLLKGLQEVKESPRPLAAADMVLVRLAYAADLPSPDEVIRRLTNAPAGTAPTASAAPPDRPAGGGGGRSGHLGLATQNRPAPRAMMAAPSQETRSEPRLRIASFEALVALAAQNRDVQLKLSLERDVRLVRFEEGSIEFSLVPGASPQIAQTLMRRLQEWTGTRWMVAISSAAGAPSLREQSLAAAEAQAVGVRADPLVRRVLEQFPGAEIVAIRTPEADVPQNSASLAGNPTGSSTDADDEIGYSDSVYTEDDL